MQLRVVSNQCTATGTGFRGDQDDDPTWQRHVFRADGSRRILKRRANGDCTFLGEADTPDLQPGGRWVDAVPSILEDTYEPI